MLEKGNVIRPLEISAWQMGIFPKLGITILYRYYSG